MNNRSSLTIALLFLVLLLAGCSTTSQPAADDQVERAFSGHSSNVQVSGAGAVLRILADDRSGLPHQRFILRLASGGTVLVEHNTDVAPRIDDLKIGDELEFSGEYIWNNQGGLVHWTHHDPEGKHLDGWLKRDGRTYQ